MQGLQHEAVAAERDQHVGVVGFVLVVLSDQRAQGALRFVGVTGEEGDAWRRGHRRLRKDGLSITRGP
ncbi:hypothetical protein D3C71_1966140 [compost metagenome]